MAWRCLIAAFFLSTCEPSLATQDPFNIDCNNIDYNLTTQALLIRGYLISQGLSKDLLSVRHGEVYMDLTFGAEKAARTLYWPLREALDSSGLIRGKDGLDRTHGTVIKYNQYLYYCTTTVERWEDKPYLFNLTIGNCSLRPNDDVRYFQMRGLDTSRAVACTRMSPVDNSDVEEKICRFTEEELAEAPMVQTRKMNLDFRELVCDSIQNGAFF